MGVERKEAFVWTCDACGESQEFDGYKPPKGWMSFELCFRGGGCDPVWVVKTLHEKFDCMNDSAKEVEKLFWGYLSK